MRPMTNEFIGWMSNWNYARNTPTKKLRSAMTPPLSLEKLITIMF
jgi:fructan beta-fructosidase